MKTPIVFIPIVFTLFSLKSPSQTPEGGKLLLKDNWAIQSSKEIKSDARTISSAGFRTDGWYPTSVPATVLATLVANKVYPDPYYGTNFNNLPGMIPYPKRDMPDGSPFKVAWWFRSEFKIPADYKKMHTWLQFHSINYKANVSLNGKLIADTTEIEGAYRLFNLDISKAALPGEIISGSGDISSERNQSYFYIGRLESYYYQQGMGIWYDVSVHATGDVAIKDPHVVTKLNLHRTIRQN